MTGQTTGGQPQLNTVKRYEEVKEYQHVPAMCDSKRLAHFANWAATTMPGITIPYNIAFRAIFACARTPAPDSTEARKIRGILPRAKSELMVTYRRSVITERGVGFRATEDDEAILKITYQKTGQRAQSAIRMHQREHGLITINKVPRTAENLPYIDHYKKNVHLLAQAFEPKMLAAFVYEVPGDSKPPEKK